MSAEDPLEILRELERHGVDFVVIGGVAVQAYGHPRTTRDIDVVPGPGGPNAERLAAALRDLDARMRGVDAGDLTDLDPTDPAYLEERRPLFLDTRGGHLDILFDPDGAPPYEQLRARAVRIAYAGVTIPIVDLDDLIALKRAAGRPIDREDIAVLASLPAEPQLDEMLVDAPQDLAELILGPRPAARRAARPWDRAAEAVYLYRDEFGRPGRPDAEHPLGRRPADARQRRVWERLVGRITEARTKLGVVEPALTGDLAADVRARS